MKLHWHLQLFFCEDDKPLFSVDIPYKFYPLLAVTQDQDSFTERFEETVLQDVLDVNELWDEYDKGVYYKLT